jgi:biopolymer transport protein ExbB/TolQ
MILLIKALKLRVQRRALGFTDLVPAEADFVLSAATAEDVLATLRENCDDPTRFILFNRIDLALSNLKNMGNIADVDEVFQSQADNDEGAMESSYSLLRGLIWAMPVLGFIGTVIGLSDAIGNFSGVLSETADPAGLADELRKVTDGLATAFDTTLVALVAALAIQLLMTVVHKSEEELLDDCKEYCQRRVVGKMRLTPFDRV